MKLIGILLLTGLATPAFAETLPVTLADGATWTISAEHTRRADGKGQAQNWSLKTVKQFTWHAGAKGEQATLSVTPISAVAGEGSPAEVAAGQSLAIPATLAVDESLAPLEVVNRSEVRAEFLKLAPRAATAADAVVEAATLAMIAAELGIASRGQGFTLKPDQEISAESALPNPFGGPPLRGVQTAKLVAIDKKAGRAVIKWRQGLDPASLKDFVTSLVASVDPAKRAQAQATFATAAVAIDTDCLYEIDIKTGLARRGECYTDTAVTLQGKTETASDRWVISQTMPGTS